MKTRKPPKKKSRSSAEEDRFYTAECLYVLRTTWERLRGGGGNPIVPFPTQKMACLGANLTQSLKKILIILPRNHEMGMEIM